MKDSISHKKKALRNAIKYALYLFFICNYNFIYSQKQQDNDDYLIANEVIQKYRGGKDTIFLTENTESNKRELGEYYRYKYFGESSTKIVIGVKNDSLIYAGKEETDKWEKGWFSRFEPLDSILSKEDFESFLAKDNFEKWDGSRLKNAKLFSEEEIESNLKKTNKRLWVTRISRPFYSTNKKYAGIFHYSRMGGYLILFKRINNEWIEINRITSI